MKTGSRTRLGRVRLSARHELDVTLEVIADGVDTLAPQHDLVIALAARGRTWARTAIDVDAARRLAELLERGAERVTASARGST